MSLLEITASKPYKRRTYTVVDFIKVGDVYGGLTVVALANDTKIQNKYGSRLITCLCICGNICLVRKDRLVKDIATCGCRMFRKVRIKKERKKVRIFLAPVNIKISGYINGAKSRGYAWELSKEEAIRILLSPCYYCGEANSCTSKRAKDFMFFGGIDRLDNSIGYTLINSVSCCTSCNIMKGTKTVEEFIEKIKQISVFLLLDKPTTLLSILKNNP